MYETTEELDAFFDTFFDIKKERRLGEGQFGLAVLALDETEQSKKVFKLPRDEQTTEALKIEGKNLRTLERLMSPNIIRLYKYGRVKMEWNGREEVRYYLCLAFGGTSLRHKLGELPVEFDVDANPTYKGSGLCLPVEEALRISIDVCQGLEVAHGFKDSKVRIIHRDIKPENILIDDETGVARIADFGISRVVDRSTGICTIAGTLLYMDPECFQGHAGPYSDIYSLGIVMYEMFTGQLPFSNFPARMTCPPKDPCHWNPDVPEALAQVILRAIDNDLKHRYANARELLADLRAIRASLDPFPTKWREDWEKVKDLGSRRTLWQNKKSPQQAIVHLVESEATLADLEREKTVAKDLKLPAIEVPTEYFCNEHILGIVSIPPEGRTLHETLGGTPVTGTNGLTLMCELMAKMCDVVAAANGRGIVHGYLSPQHVYCDREHGITLHNYGNTLLLRLRKPGARGSQAFIEAFRDFLPFMSPQVLEGRKPVPSDDVFSLGSLMYTLLTGQPYADVDTLQRLVGGDTVEPLVPNPRAKNFMVTKRLADVIVQAMDWNEDNRPESAADIAAILRQCKWPDDIVDTLTQDAIQQYQKGDIVGAYEVIEKGLYADPGNPHIHYTRGMIYYWEKEYRWAIKELQKSAEVIPTFDVYLLEGRCYADLSKNEKAVEKFFKALEYGDSPELQYLLAVSLRKIDRPEEARDHMKCSITLETDKSVREERERQLSKWDETQEIGQSDS